MENEEKILNWIVGFFILASIQGIVAFLALLLRWEKVMYFFYLASQ